MRDAEVVEGKKVVERIIKSLCDERAVNLTADVEWQYDFNRMVFWLKLEIDGQEKAWQLSYEALADSANDKNVREEIERGLAMYVIPNRPLRTPDESVQESKQRPYDVFLCHASEDKEFVDPLAKALRAAVIRVWYDQDLMSWGDDLRGSIDKGLANSRYGIVVFSKAFLKKKHWTEHELNGLFAKERAGNKVILPIWHDITEENLLAYSPAFADRLAKRSSKDSIEDIVEDLKTLLARDDVKGAEYCYVTPLPVHDYRPVSQGRPIVIINPFDRPVYDVTIRIRTAAVSLAEEAKTSRSSINPKADVATLKPGTVIPGPSGTGLNLQAGTYSIEIRTNVGIFAEILVIRRRDGKLISDFTLTRLSDAHVLIPGKSLLKRG